MEPIKNKKLKIAFVGQIEYFRCIYEHDLDNDYNVKEFKLVWGAPWYYYANLIEYNPDIIFFFRPELYSDELLKKLSGKKVALSSEPIPQYINGRLHTSEDREYRFNSLKNSRGKFDYFYHFDKNSLPFLEEKGIKADGDFLFPVATGTYKPLSSPKKWDAFFGGRDTAHREAYLGVLKRDHSVLHITHGIEGSEYVRLVNMCRIGINIHVDEHISIEHRIQNMMACGVMVMSEPLSPNNIFIAGKHYIEFRNKKDFWDQFLYYLRNDAQREVIARNGLAMVKEKLNSLPNFKKLISEITKL